MFPVSHFLKQVQLLRGKLLFFSLSNICITFTRSWLLDDGLFEVKFAEETLELILESLGRVDTFLVVAARVARVEHAQHGVQVYLAHVGQLQKEIKGVTTST